MKGIARLAALAGAAMTLALPGATAQAPCGLGAGGIRYDPATEKTIMGTIVEVRHHDCMGWQGVHLQLKTDVETFDVHLGPLAYVEQGGVAFAPGERVEVVGAPFEASWLARVVRKGEAKLILRDTSGLPLWSGHHRRHRHHHPEHH